MERGNNDTEMKKFNEWYDNLKEKKLCIQQSYGINYILFK